ncbi:PREDICTED: complement C5-like, partial [Priapulus caudatus]|uniref:Complement C5-like n=1 Tax=Priapulus caudatus TaxID=37621 RepID=A0ABM1EFD7_PRICU
PGYFIAAPNVFRVGVEESVSVDVYDTGGATVTLTLTLQDYPARTHNFSQVVVDCSEFQPVTVQLRIAPADVVRDTALGFDADTKYVYLSASSTSPGLTFHEDIPVLLRHASGHLFLHTDKPVYTPDQHVRIRAFPLNEDLVPQGESVRIDVVNPQAVTVDRLDVAVGDTGFISKTFVFPAFPVFGNWSVVGYHGPQLKYNSTAKFEVKEYILPTFSVTVGAPRFILPQDERISGNVSARHEQNTPALFCQ